MIHSAIYDGWVMHRRLAPKHHAFKYRVFSLLLDLDELEGLGRRLRLFGWNRGGIVSFHDRDHGGGKDLRQWLDGLLAREGIVADGPRRVLCYPRLFGYVFNPISTWFCYDAGERLAAIVYEVNNTYDESHAYVLRVGGDTTVLRAGNDDTLVRHSCAKAFYVSPFLSMDCTYNFKVRPPGDDVLVAIAEEEVGKPVLTATFSGRRKALSDGALLAMLLRHPLMTVKIIAAIHYEAVRLMWKGVARHAHGTAG